jgi:hypothetical protein
VAIERRTGCEYADGAIRVHVRGLEFVVQLDDGREVTAILPKSRIRQIGCLFGDLVGCRAVLVFRAAPLLPAILEIRPRQP